MIPLMIAIQPKIMTPARVAAGAKIKQIRPKTMNTIPNRRSHIHF
jgi:hypothetical protein